MTVTTTHPDLSDADAAARAREAGRLLDAMRARKPHVHSITNLVANNFTANLLLAAGAIPSMTDARDEVAAFVARADALLVNIGTLDARQGESIELAVDAANEAGKPWILDPVFVHFSPPRLAFARKSLEKKPAVLRGNAQELAALVTGTADGQEAKGLDDEAVMAFAREQGASVARSGAVDLVSDGTQAVRVENGHPCMAQVTAVGCAVTALMGAFLTVAEDRVSAVASTLALAGLAGERAAEGAEGPGTFAARFIDQFNAIDAAALTAGARFS